MEVISQKMNSWQRQRSEFQSIFVSAQIKRIQAESFMLQDRKNRRDKFKAQVISIHVILIKVLSHKLCILGA